MNRFTNLAAGTARRQLSSAATKQRNVVLVDGCRIPFTLAGTNYKNYLAVDLARFALKGLLTKTALDPEDVSTFASHTKHSYSVLVRNTPSRRLLYIL